MPPFVIDASIWIHIWRHHPPDIFAGLWQQLDASIAVGDVISADEVLRELERGTDDLAEVLGQRQGLFVAMDEGRTAAVSEVMARCPGLVDPDAERDRADPFVVALAWLRNGKVVTRERARGQSAGRPRIPDVCGELGVPWLDWFGFLRAAGWRL